MIKILNSKFKALGKVLLGGQGTPQGGVGKYWYTTTSDNDADKWHTLTSWYLNSNNTNQATLLPDSNTDVVIQGSIGPIADLDREDWVQPQSINSGTAGVTFTSQTNQNVTASITGTATFLGNATYNI